MWSGEAAVAGNTVGGLPSPRPSPGGRGRSARRPKTSAATHPPHEQGEQDAEGERDLQDGAEAGLLAGQGVAVVVAVEQACADRFGVEVPAVLQRQAHFDVGVLWEGVGVGFAADPRGLRGGADVDHAFAHVFGVDADGAEGDRDRAGVAGFGAFDADIDDGFALGLRIGPCGGVVDQQGHRALAGVVFETADFEAAEILGLGLDLGPGPGLVGDHGQRFRRVPAFQGHRQRVGLRDSCGRQREGGDEQAGGQAGEACGAAETCGHEEAIEQGKGGA